MMHYEVDLDDSSGPDERKLAFRLGRLVVKEWWIHKIDEDIEACGVLL